MNATMGGPVFELTDVAKVYPGWSTPVTALAGVSVRIDAGERVAVIGPSGSGKTTLLGVLGTLERASAGIVRLRGRDVSSLADAELSAIRAYQLGFVFQQFHLLDHASAIANVCLGLLYRGHTVRQRVAVATRTLERVGLGHRLAHRPGQLSGGERQRVAIARAIAGRPSAILADEPTGNLDSATGAEIIALLAGLADDGTAVIVVTHDAHVAAAMDRQLSMRDGRIITDQLIRRPDVSGPC
jgi:putative ABC transport system ATP-binding protein